MSLTVGNNGNRQVVLDVGQYPDKTPVVDLEDAWNRIGMNPEFIIVKPNSLDEFITAMMVVDSFAERGGRIKNLIIPFIPGGRQDRQKWEGDWLLTLKFVAKMINDRNFDRVITIDPHSMVTGALINRLVTTDDLLVPVFKTIGKNSMIDGVISPDLGAVKRAESAAKVLDVPVFTATKRRDPSTNKLSGFHFVDPLAPELNYLVVDDICDAGGTFLGLAQEAKKVYGVNLHLFVTHGLFTKGTDELLKSYETVHSTNSTDPNYDKYHVNTYAVTESMVHYV